MQSQKSVESPRSASSLGPQRHDSVGAISQRIEASRILFFCESSIYTIISESPAHDIANILIDQQVTNQIHLRREDSGNSLTLYCGTERNGSLPIHITEGTAERPAGIPLSFSSTSRDLHHSNINCREYSSIQVIFPNRDG